MRRILLLVSLLCSTSAFAISVKQADNNLFLIEAARAEAAYCQSKGFNTQGRFDQWLAGVSKARQVSLAVLRKDAQARGVDADQFIEQTAQRHREEAARGEAFDPALCRKFNATLGSYRSGLEYGQRRR